MNCVMDYILNSLSSTDEALKHVNKVLRSQRRTNRNVTLFMVLTAAYVAVEARERQEQNKKIRRLSKEIEELKQSEGE